MRYLLLSCLLIYSVFSFSQHSSFVKKLPNRQKMVTDFGKFLTSSDKDSLEVELKGYLDRTTNSIVVVTLESLTDPETEKEYTIEEAGLLYFNTWGVGDKDKNNGVMLLVSRHPRKVRIQVGTGLENNLTNDYCQEIVDNNLVPYFKDGQFYAGIKQAIAAIENRIDHPAANDQQAALPSYLRPAIKKNEFEVAHYGKGSTVTVVSVIGGILVVCFLFIRFGKPLSSGWYTRNGYTTNDLGLFSRHSSGSSCSGGGYSSSSSSSGGGGYGGGSSSGGGASGSW